MKYIRINAARLGIERCCSIYHDFKNIMPYAVVFIDTYGNKTRVSISKSEMDVGNLVLLTHSHIDETKIGLDYNLFKEILLGDDIVIRSSVPTVLKVESIVSNDIVARHIGGTRIIGNKSHIYIRDRHIPYCHLSYRDLILLKSFEGKSNIGLSFADTPSLISMAKQICIFSPIFAKIESPTGVENAESILKNADGIIVGRDDLMAHYSFDEIQEITIYLLRLCNSANKVCIPASNMFLGLIEREELNGEEMELLRKCKNEGARLLYCNESVLTTNRKIVRKLINCCENI